MDLIGEWSEFDFDLFNYLTSDDDKYSPVCDENIDSFDVTDSLCSSKLFADLAPPDKELKTVDLSFNLPQVLSDVLPQVLNSPKEGDSDEINVLTSREESNLYTSVTSTNFPFPQTNKDKSRKVKSSVCGEKKKLKNEWLASVLAAPRPSDLNRNVIMDPSHNIQIEAVGVVGCAEDFALVDGRVLLPRVPCQSPAPLPLDRRPLHPPHFRHRYVAALQHRLSRVHRLPAPTQERKLDVNTITDEERDLMPEFFRTPLLTARYLKIRNHIVSCWESSRPSYVSKRSIRPGLKNCGDVNLISRVHIYLERKGLINFGSVRCHYLSETSGWNPNQEEQSDICSKVCNISKKGSKLLRQSLVG